MKKLFVIALFFFACQSVSNLAQEPARRFPITFEMDGKKVQTSVTLRIKHGGKLTEIKYIQPNRLHSRNSDLTTGSTYGSLQINTYFRFWICTLTRSKSLAGE